MRSPSAFLLALLLPLSASNAEDITVDLNGTGDFTEVQPAIDAAQQGCTVLVKAGEYMIQDSIRFRV